MTTPATRTPATARDADIRDLDLAPIVYLLITRKGWSEQQAHAAEREYKGLLQRRRDAPGQPLVPSLRADAFWHEHLMVNELYNRQCMALFGEVLHHHPFTEPPVPRAPLRRRLRRLLASLFERGPGHPA